jgi:hypothetical protein
MLVYGKAFICGLNWFFKQHLFEAYENMNCLWLNDNGTL